MTRGPASSQIARLTILGMLLACSCSNRTPQHDAGGATVPSRGEPAPADAAPDAPPGAEVSVAPTDDGAVPRVVAVAPEGYVALASGRLGRGHAIRTFDVARDCPLARLELEVEIESMPDGSVTLRAPDGTAARLPLHILATTHFVRTWDWSALEALHGLRGRSMRGPWTVELSLRGAMYRTDPVPMPTPEIRDTRLRLWCEPTSVPAAHHTIQASSEGTFRRAWPGGSVRALAAIEEQCAIGELQVEIAARRERTAFGQSWSLISPDGARHELTVWPPGRGPDRRTSVVTVPSARGSASAGIWELQAPRAQPDLVLERFGLTVTCAGS